MKNKFYTFWLLIALVTLIVGTSGTAEAKGKKGSHQCKYLGEKVSCAWFEKCFVDGGVAEKVDGELMCCWDDGICIGQPGHKRQLPQPLPPSVFQQKRNEQLQQLNSSPNSSSLDR